MALFFDNDCLAAIGIDIAPRHLDVAGRPLCNREAEGEVLVDEPVHVTCSACLVGMGDLLNSGKRS